MIFSEQPHRIIVKTKIAGKTFSEIKTEGSSDYVKQFWTYTLQIEYLYDDNTDLISSVFDRLNRNGEPLNRQELRKARYANTPIMTVIQKLTENSAQMGSANLLANVPKEGARMALCIIATLPILFVYPFFQKYFIQGLTVGSVKE